MAIHIHLPTPRKVKDAEYNPREFRRISSKIADLEVEARSESGATREATLAQIAKLKKELTKYRDAVNPLGEQTYRTYEAWKAACKKQNPSVVFEGNKDICNAKPGVGEWDGETGLIYKTRDAVPSVGEKVRVQAEPGRMVEGIIKSLRGNMATVAYTIEGSSPRLEDYHVTKIFSLAGKAFSPRDSSVGKPRK